MSEVKPEPVRHRKKTDGKALNEVESESDEEDESLIQKRANSLFGFQVLDSKTRKELVK
jgi:hypothetical protein